MTSGQCLCGNIEFLCDLQQSPVKIYQCHCSLCKKQSGSSSNSAIIIPSEKFKWVKNQGIKVWQKDTGFSSHFCDNCGCGVPNSFANKYYWIPVGLLDLNAEVRVEVKVVAHFCLSAQSNWHELNLDSEKFQELPELPKIIALLE
jgi:hypothetical protein